MADSERGESTEETVKRRALIRLAVAGAITVAALAGLWWLDKSGQPPPERKPAPPAPIVTAPAPAPPPEPLAPEPGPSAAEVGDRPEPPSVPPPRVSNFTAPPPAAAPPAAAPRPVPKPETQTQAALPPPAPTISPVARGYVLQVGVFSNPDNAKQLLERLHREGIRAYSETRVQVGPFQSREEAEKARLALDRLGIRGVITPQGATR